MVGPPDGTNVSSFDRTGFAVSTAQNAPAEWRVTHFRRLGPDDMPRN